VEILAILKSIMAKISLLRYEMTRFLFSDMRFSVLRVCL